MKSVTVEDAVAMVPDGALLETGGGVSVAQVIEAAEAQLTLSDNIQEMQL